ncbi:hypothetical protein BDEG_26739 [Batrachochytrium dendrobatidis JEL423]|uniref:Peptidase A1 domain-containing protein n=1 Tax=Batrachochytrium dendrobatidis (strain JEL423) TaxID=403673 RepID=A0A177WTY5_BATDL|nr:hypothetical protein BDEG_26739 [Batrachochytrium dendrobatidis JEL423]
MADIVVPLPSSSNDVGLTPQHTPSGEPVTIDYKGDEYNGFSSTATVTIPGTRIAGINLPVLAVQKQSPDSVGISSKFDGIFGLGYPSLSNHHPPATAMDALYTNDVIPNNEIGLQLCPYEMTSNSFINIGNTDVTAKCGTDGTSVAWVQSPSDNQFSVNIKSILVNDEPVDLPEEFQKKVENGRTLYSSVETCFLHMRFPEAVVEADKLGKVMVKKIFSQNYAMLESGFDIDWGKLPTLSITMFAQNPVTDANCNSVVTIKLGPKDYIQRAGSKNCKFAIKAGSNDNAVLGIPFMAQLGLTFDLQNKRIGLGPGCGCKVSTDGYPTISNGYRVLWPLPRVRLPEQPSTSSSEGTFIRRRKP